jgi:hypothetical protein
VGRVILERVDPLVVAEPDEATAKPAPLRGAISSAR